MKIFNKVSVKEFAEFFPVTVSGTEGFNPKILENEILFIEIKRVPFSEDLLYLVVFGLPDNAEQFKALKTLSVWVINWEEWANQAKPLFQQWFSHSSHTLVMFDSVKDLRPIVQTLNLISLGCQILDLSVVLEIGQIGLFNDSKKLFYSIIHSLDEDFDPRRLTSDEWNTKYEQLVQKSASLSQTPLTTEILDALVLEVAYIGEYLKICSERSFPILFWSNSFSKIRMNSLEVYKKYFSALIPAFVFLNVHGVAIDVEKIQKIQNDLNGEFSPLQADYQKLFGVNLMDIQTPKDLLLLRDKLNFSLPVPQDQWEKVLERSVAANLLTDGAFLQAFQRIKGKESWQLNLLAKGFDWHKKNRLIFEWISKMKNQKLFLSYNFRKDFLGSFECTPDLEEMKNLFSTIFVPRQNHIFLKVSFKNLRLRFLYQILQAFIQDEKLNAFLRKCLQDDLYVEAILAGFCGQSMALPGSWRPLGAEPSGAEPPQIFIFQKLMSDERTNFSAALDSFRQQMRQTFIDSQKNGSNYPLQTALGGLPIFFPKKDSASDEFLTRSALELSIFEMQAFLWGQIFSKGQDQPFPKVLFVFEDEIILESPQKWVEAPMEMDKILEALSQKFLPSIGLDWQIEQIDQW